MNQTQDSNTMIVFLFMGAIVIVMFRRTLYHWLAWGLLILMILTAIFGDK